MCHRLLRIIVKGRRRRIATTCAMFLRGRRTAFFFFRDIVCQAGNIDLLFPFSRRIFVNRRILVDKINYYQNRKILSILWLILFNLYIYIYHLSKFFSTFVTSLLNFHYFLLKTWKMDQWENRDRFPSISGNRKIYRAYTWWLRWIYLSLSFFFFI